MEKLKFNPSNKKYYSEEFIKGFECGVERQYEVDMKEQEPKIWWWIFHKSFDNGHKNCNECIECSQCHTWFGYDCYNRTPYCPNCGAKMKGEADGK